jgi:hypothetical protein
MTPPPPSATGAGSPRSAAAEAADEAVPVSVRLGTVVPPEDPEDWRRPLTWLAAAGMLLAPALVLLWFVIAPPAQTTRPMPGTWLIAGALVVGGVLTGTTQQRPAWAAAATLGAALFEALLVVLYAVAISPEVRVGALTPVLAQAVSGAVAGLAGSLVAATLMPAFSRLRSRVRRGWAPAAIGIAVSAIVVRLLLPA